MACGHIDQYHQHHLMKSFTEIEIPQVKFGSRAKKLGVDQGYKIQDLQLPNPARPSQFWGLFPGVALALLIWFLQGRRMKHAT